MLAFLRAMASFLTCGECRDRDEAQSAESRLALLNCGRSYAANAVLALLPVRNMLYDSLTYTDQREEKKEGKKG